MAVRPAQHAAPGAKPNRGHPHQHQRSINHHSCADDRSQITRQSADCKTTAYASMAKVYMCDLLTCGWREGGLDGALGRLINRFLLDFVPLVYGDLRKDELWEHFERFGRVRGIGEGDTLWACAPCTLALAA